MVCLNKRSCACMYASDAQRSSLCDGILRVCEFPHSNCRLSKKSAGAFSGSFCWVVCALASADMHIQTLGFCLLLSHDNFKTFSSRALRFLCPPPPTPTH
eukprot:TRINITY_DN8819_c0_g1_i1.p2 TRINITY_DN8819_c0_g1~~TRINITY_DN8819_c0_g1_i1.p2  ORF type:complete len:100 (-),score=1.40 TRINITY_DN8819_c0_g1_i1:63-362(-)